MFELWKDLHYAPFHFPTDETVWTQSMFEDTDSDCRVLFTALHTEETAHAMVQYGCTAFGLDENGNISEYIHYPVIRDLAFAPEHAEEGEALLKKAMEYFPASPVYTHFFTILG